MKISANMDYVRIVVAIAEDLEGCLNESLDFTQTLIPGFNPVRDHASDVKVDGCSRFYKVKNTRDAIELAKISKLVEVRRGRDEGHGKAIILVFEAPEEIGETAESVPISGEVYTMQKVHGSLQATGTVSYWPMSTRIFCIVLTPENADGDVAFATAHPGLPDPDPRPGYADLKEGEELDAFSVLLYGLRPTARKS